MPTLNSKQILERAARDEKFAEFALGAGIIRKGSPSLWDSYNVREAAFIIACLLVCVYTTWAQDKTAWNIIPAPVRYTLLALGGLLTWAWVLVALYVFVALLRGCSCRIVGRRW
jgi:hypothetical protein